LPVHAVGLALLTRRTRIANFAANADLAQSLMRGLGLTASAKRTWRSIRVFARLNRYLGVDVELIKSAPREPRSNLDSSLLIAIRRPSAAHGAGPGASLRPACAPPVAANHLVTNGSPTAIKNGVFLLDQAHSENNNPFSQLTRYCGPSIPPSSGSSVWQTIPMGVRE